MHRKVFESMRKRAEEKPIEFQSRVKAILDKRSNLRHEV